MEKKQALGRDGGKGIKKSAMKDIVKNPKKIIIQSGGRVRYESEKGVVVLNKDGKVVTTWAKSKKYWR